MRWPLLPLGVWAADLRSGRAPKRQPLHNDLNCNIPMLPPQIILMPHSCPHISAFDLEFEFGRVGAWQTTDGAEFISWSQDLYSAMPRNIWFTWDKMLVGTVVEDEHRVTLKNCNDQVIYQFQYGGVNQILKPNGQIATYLKKVEDKLYLVDPERPGKPIGWLDQRHTLVRAPNGTWTHDTGADYCHVPRYALTFEPLSDHELVLPYHRWVLGAFVQLMALREADKIADGTWRIQKGEGIVNTLATIFFIITLIAFLWCIGLFCKLAYRGHDKHESSTAYLHVMPDYI